MKKISFHQDWTFSGTDRIRGRVLKKVQLPHDASIEMVRNPSEASGGANGYFQQGNYIYEKCLDSSDFSEDARVILEFEGVYHNASVYINQTLAGKCADGYTGFYVDATAYLRRGPENWIRVVVRNDAYSSRWYTGGGIYRNVNLLTSGRFHLPPDSVRLTTKDAQPDLAAVQAEITVENRALGVQTGWLHIELCEAGRAAADNCVPVTVMEHERRTYRIPLYVREPRLWDDEHPELYHYRAWLEADGQCLDEETGTFGIRTMQLDPRYGLRINGRTVKLRGGCIHHDNGILGAAEFPHAARTRVRALKAAGYNAIRSSHCPLSKAMLEACDQYGMYVIDELADAWTVGKTDFDCSTYLSEQYAQMISAMVCKDYNHPCVILYSIGNEIPELSNPLSARFGKELADCFHRLDPHRYVTNGISVLICMNEQKRRPLNPDADTQNGDAVEPSEINKLMQFLGDNAEAILQTRASAQAVEEAASHLDVVGYNYCARRYLEDQREYPNRILVGTETYPPDLDRNWSLVQQYPNVIGDFGWTAWDYLGEAGIGQLEYDSNQAYCFYPGFGVKAAYCGDFNLIGERRPISYWRQTVWEHSARPYLAVQPPQHYGETKLITKWVMSDAVRSWNFEGQEGKPVVVEVYADADEVELLNNGVSCGRKAVGGEKDCRVLFDTVYQPGSLSAIAYRSGVPIGRDVLQTAGKAQIDAFSDREWIPADGSDIGYVEISLRDQHENLQTGRQERVRIRIEGPGLVQGFGSADPKSNENYFDREAMTYEGCLRAAVRGTGEPGLIRVLLTAEDGISKVVVIRAE